MVKTDILLLYLCTNPVGWRFVYAANCHYKVRKILPAGIQLLLSALINVYQLLHGYYNYNNMHILQEK